MNEEEANNKAYYSRKHEACKICGVDADCMYVDQELGKCNACVNSGY